MADVTIDIKRKRPKRGVVEPTRGPIDIKRPIEYLARRKKPDQGIYLRVFDCGATFAGGDTDFIHDPNPRLKLIPGSDGFGPANRYDFNTTYDYASDWNTWLFAVDKSGWETRFKEITDLSEYGVTIAGAGVYAPGHGFMISSGNLDATGGLAFRKFTTADAGHYKITHGTTFDSAEVPFDRTKDAELYLMPVIAQWQGRGKVKLNPDFTSPFYDYLLDGYRRPLPRPGFLGSSLLRALTVSSPLAGGYVQVWHKPTGPLLDITIRNFFLNLFEIDGGRASLIRVEGYTAFHTDFYTAHSAQSPSIFPTISTTGVVGPDIFDPQPGPVLQMIDGVVPAHLCVAAVKVDTVWFFVWTKFEMPLNSLGVVYRIYV